MLGENWWLLLVIPLVAVVVGAAAQLIDRSMKERYRASMEQRISQLESRTAGLEKQLELIISLTKEKR